MRHNAALQIKQQLCEIISDKRGQGLAEFALILLLVAIVVFAALGIVGNTTNGFYTSYNMEMNK